MRERERERERGRERERERDGLVKKMSFARATEIIDGSGKLNDHIISLNNIIKLLISPN